MLGYAAMNRTLREETPPVRCNRSMREATFEDRGLEYVAELAVQNLSDLLTTLQWNVRHGIFFYRCTSKLIPWNLRYEIERLPRFDEIRRLAERIGEFVETNGVRLTFHPNYYCKLASTSTDTAERSARDLANHGRWLDLMGLPRRPYYGIVVHVGATYGDREATLTRFCARVDDLPAAAADRLTVENDDEEALYSADELVRGVAEECGVPVTLDYHHHSFTDRGYSYREAYDLARETWDGPPVVHLSEAERLHTGDTTTSPQSHADYVAEIPAWLRASDADVMLEAHAKERAVLYHTLDHETGGPADDHETGCPAENLEHDAPPDGSA
ncbi:UV DNA damage repair endonuclease UvsE [Halobaculum sp. MBLA0147]|uniref:UV DNA damage repair endonuclease UvsE n=1 Tax=Halobaculum sp. MBLA0147 TaxID=3079934 RepID=UPI003523ACCC